MTQLLILSLATFLLSLLTTGWVKQRFSQNLLDIPNDRLLGSLVVDRIKIRNTLGYIKLIAI